MIIMNKSGYSNFYLESMLKPLDNKNIFILYTYSKSEPGNLEFIRI